MSNRQQRKLAKQNKRIAKGCLSYADGLPVLKQTYLDGYGNLCEREVPPEEWIAKAITDLPQELRDKLA